MTEHVDAVDDGTTYAAEQWRLVARDGYRYQCHRGHAAMVLDNLEIPVPRGEHQAAKDASDEAAREVLS